MTMVRARTRTLREVLRELARGLSPWYRIGTEPIAIAQLVSPLRYDVIVRTGFFEFLSDHRPLLEQSVDRFVAAVRETDYFTWYTTVAVNAIGIAGRQPVEIDAAFRQRVLRSVALADSMAAKGFVPRPPLTIRSSPAVVTPSGKCLGPRQYPLDGCHRLALLRQQGRTHLQPGEYRVTARSGVLLDNTAVLIDALVLDEGRYLPFLASGYLDRSVADRADLVAAVAAAHPERSAELESVLAVDEALLARRNGEASGPGR